MFDPADKREKKRYYEKQANLVVERIWDLEFKKTTLKRDREHLRRQHDRVMDNYRQAEARIAVEKKKKEPDKTVLENLPKLLDQHAQDIKQLQEYIQKIDSGITGPEGLDAYMAAYQGRLKALREYMESL